MCFHNVTNLVHKTCFALQPTPMWLHCPLCAQDSQKGQVSGKQKGKILESCPSFTSQQCNPT